MPSSSALRSPTRRHAPSQLPRSRSMRRLLQRPHSRLITKTTPPLEPMEALLTDSWPWLRLLACGAAPRFPSSCSVCLTMVARALTVLTMSWLVAGAPAYIYAELGGVDHWVWFVTANLLATAAVAPFVGAMSDLAGRRQIALAGSFIIILGQVICCTARTMDVFIGRPQLLSGETKCRVPANHRRTGGMSITGMGTGINELTVLAGTAELVPLSKRGYYLAAVSATMIPYIPSVMYAQVISYTSSWRYIGTITIGASFIALIMTFLFYSPPKPSRDSVQTKGEILKKLDFIGGFLATAGLAILEIGILGGGYSVSNIEFRVTRGMLTDHVCNRIRGQARPFLPPWSLVPCSWCSSDFGRPCGLRIPCCLGDSAKRPGR